MINENLMNKIENVKLEIETTAQKLQQLKETLKSLSQEYDNEILQELHNKPVTFKCYGMPITGRIQRVEKGLIYLKAVSINHNNKVLAETRKTHYGDHVTILSEEEYKKYITDLIENLVSATLID